MSFKNYLIKIIRKQGQEAMKIISGIRNEPPEGSTSNIQLVKKRLCLLGGRRDIYHVNCE
ncbi:hypothetical protein AKJ16_DCAP06099 [Drosera capensis]